MSEGHTFSFFRFISRGQPYRHSSSGYTLSVSRIIPPVGFSSSGIRGDKIRLPARKTTPQTTKPATPDLVHQHSRARPTDAHSPVTAQVTQSQPKALDQAQSGTNAPGPDLQCRSGPGLGNYSPTGTSTKGIKACTTMRFTAELLGSFHLQKPPRNVIWLLREELLQLPSSTDHPPAWQQPQGTCHQVPSTASNQGHARLGRP